MKIQLSSRMERFVEDCIASGQFDTPGAVVEAGLLLLHAQLEQQKLESLRRDIQAGLDDIANGRIMTAEESHARVMKRYKDKFGGAA